MRGKWKPVRDLFERALTKQPADLDAWLEREAPDDPEVRDEVRSLLENEERAKNFLTQPATSPRRWPRSGRPSLVTPCAGGVPIRRSS